jgi:membrane protein YqaA with SNARE-associated domain
LGALIAYGGLFLAAFVAATILPAQSEAVLAGLVASGTYSTFLLIVVATIGNTLGAIVNWWLGGLAGRLQSKSWFPVAVSQLERAREWYRRWGKWSLLLSWLPFGGDALTVVAGTMREPLVSFVVIVGLAKLLRYLVVAGLVTTAFM